MKNRDRKRPKGDKYALIRAVPGALVPDAVPGRAGRKYADPEMVLQGEVNDLLKTINQFHFRNRRSDLLRQNRIGFQAS